MDWRLSAVRVFHRISLAEMLSVSSNKDGSNSTLTSGISGDLTKVTIMTAALLSTNCGVTVFFV